MCISFSFGLSHRNRIFSLYILDETSGRFKPPMIESKIGPLISFTNVSSNHFQSMRIRLFSFCKQFFSVSISMNKNETKQPKENWFYFNKIKIHTFISCLWKKFYPIEASFNLLQQFSLYTFHLNCQLFESAVRLGHFLDICRIIVYIY